MIVPKNAKVEKCASKDQTRPVLTALHVRETDDPAVGMLEATDSYVLVRVPVTLESGDVAGLVPASALVEARKTAGRLADARLSVNGDVAYTTKDGAEVHAPRPEGTFPRANELFPDGEVAFEIGVNPALLVAAAEAMGSPDGIRLTFVRKRGSSIETDADNLRPIKVQPLKGVNGAEAIVMPIRIG